MGARINIPDQCGKAFQVSTARQATHAQIPATTGIEICAQWLDRELALLRPEAAVALSAAAARALTGHPVAVMRERGNWLESPDGLPVLVTLHPSALLHGPSAEREQAFERWLDDLKKASAYVKK